MKTPVILFAVLVSLAGCQRALPSLDLRDVPPDRFLQTIEQQRRSFSSMKALARVEVERRGRVRVYESVAILQKGYEKLRIEAAGPLGESLLAVLWDGAEVSVRRPGETEPLNVGPSGLERIIGISLSPADLCALLTGNAPEQRSGVRAAAGCDTVGRCVVQYRGDDLRWSTHLVPSGGDLAITGVDLYRGSRLVLASRFEQRENGDASRLPNRVEIEDLERKVRFVVLYGERDVNVPVDDRAFTLSGQEEADHP